MEINKEKTIEEKAVEYGTTDIQEIERIDKIKAQAEARGAEKALQQVLDSEEMELEELPAVYMTAREARGFNQAITAIRKKIESISKRICR